MIGAILDAFGGLLNLAHDHVHDTMVWDAEDDAAAMNRWYRS